MKPRVSENWQERSVERLQGLRLEGDGDQNKDEENGCGFHGEEYHEAGLVLKVLQ